jgi:23S rRNA (cytidine1920-2'-O)/16S rRNA (cytidine1409-2'-O)-methyltransferase
MIILSPKLTADFGLSYLIDCHLAKVCCPPFAICHSSLFGYALAMTKIRLDVYVTKQGLVTSRAQAQALIMAGRVRLDGQVATKPGMSVPAGAEVTLEAAPAYVSRGGLKLAAALDAFALDPRGAICADVGASTGGFTDVLLQRGARRVYAIDVGYGQLAWKLRQDPRVVVMERTNARLLTGLPEPVSLVTIDASFISLSLLVPAVLRWRDETLDLVALVKPQFEVGKGQVGKGGVVRDPAAHRRVLAEVSQTFQGLGGTIAGLSPSPLLGPAGNREFLLYAVWGRSSPTFDVASAIAACTAPRPEQRRS